MSRPALEKVRAEALNLTEAERAELAQFLMASLDGAAEPQVEDAWEREVLRRIAAIETGTAELIDREELRRRIHTRMYRR